MIPFGDPSLTPISLPPDDHQRNPRLHLRHLSLEASFGPIAYRARGTSFTPLLPPALLCDQATAPDVTNFLAAQRLAWSLLLAGCLADHPYAGGRAMVEASVLR